MIAMHRWIWFCACWVAWPAVDAAGARDDASVVVLKVGSVHVGNGEVFSPGVVVVREGRIIRVSSDIDIPAGARVIDQPQAHITPGLIDANAVIDAYDLWPTRTLSLRAGDHATKAPPESRPTTMFDRMIATAAAHGHVHSTDPSGEAESRESLYLGTDGTAPPPLSYLSADATVEAGYEEQLCAMCGGAMQREQQMLVSGIRDGFVDAEHSSEVVPHTRVIDAVNLRASDFDRLAMNGVTTVFVAGAPASVISSQGATLRTSGPVDQRIISETGAIRVTLGTDSYRIGGWNRTPWGDATDFYVRRPTTRMGVAWVFRKALYDTQRFEQGLSIHGADAPTPEAMQVLSRVLKGQIPLRIQARMQGDIEMALRLTEEFKLSFTLDEATEAYRCIAALKERGVPVVFGPIYEQPTGRRSIAGETRNARLHTFRALLDAGIETALSAQERRDEDGLARQAMYAIRFGVDPQAALKAVTLTPARLLGLDRELGTVEAGKRADLIVWSGEPFAATSRPVMIVSGGRMAS